jgi:hypothetical protein
MEPDRWEPKIVKWGRKSGFIGLKGPEAKAYQLASGPGKNSGGVGRPARRKKRPWNVPPKNR